MFDFSLKFNHNFLVMKQLKTIYNEKTTARGKFSARSNLIFNITSVIKLLNLRYKLQLLLFHTRGK